MLGSWDVGIVGCWFRGMFGLWDDERVFFILGGPFLNLFMSPIDTGQCKMYLSVLSLLNVTNPVIASRQFFLVRYSLPQW
jgi:hypothetical protein